MKLFIWEDVLTDYSSGMIVALAEDFSDAIKDIRERHGDSAAEETSQRCKVIDCETQEKPISFVVYGGG